MIQPPTSPVPTDALLWALPLCPMDGERTPPAVHAYVHSLHPQSNHRQKPVATLPGQVEQTSHTSRTPPASDAPGDQPTRPPRQASGQRGGRPGHRGPGPTLRRPTAVPLLGPGPCAGGPGQLGARAPYDPHPVVERPPIAMDLPPVLLPHGPGRGGGRTLTAPGPSAPQAGYGPRLPARMGARASRPRPARRLRPDCCPAGLHLPLSLGAVPKLLDRGSHALVPHDEARAPLARPATVGASAATPGYGPKAWPGRWPLRPTPGARALLPPHRSHAAGAAVREEGPGLVGRAGDGVEPGGGPHRPTCWTHRSRTARGGCKTRPASGGLGPVGAPRVTDLLPQGQSAAAWRRVARLGGPVVPLERSRPGAGR